MELSDLLVSYNQVHAPSFYSEPIIEPTSTDINWNRIKELNLPSKEEIKFKGIYTPENTQETVIGEPSYTISSGKLKSDDVINFFTSKGLTKNQAKGIYGNLMHESGGNLDIISKDGYNSYGLAQWTGNRKLRLFSKYGNKPTKQQQLEYLWEELNTTEKKALDALVKTNTVDDATKVFMDKFERPSGKYANLKDRLKYAHSIQ